MRCACWKFPPSCVAPSWCLSGQQHLTVQTMQGTGLQLATTAGQPTLQVDQTLTLELPSQPGEKKRRMACTCPNCKDADKRCVCCSCLCLRGVFFLIQFFSLRVLRVLVSGLGRWGRGNTSATSPDVRRPSGKRRCSERTCACTPASGPSSAAGFSAANASRAATSCSDTPGRTQVRPPPERRRRWAFKTR